MYSEIPQGSKIDIQGLICNLPPEGYVYNVATKQIEHRGVYSRSDNPEEQYWERIPLPDWYKKVIKSEDEYNKKKKDDDPDFYDARYEEYKKEQWDKRLNGMWFMNNGKPTYITGSHYMFMQWFLIDIGYPRFRIPDLEYFYFLQYCIEDPNCMGMIEITKRRFGKTFRAGLFLIEYVTRTRMTNAGIQSKTGGDAKKLFSKAVVNPFKKLPRFFRPEYDMSLGITPKTEIRFQQTNVRGKKAEDNLDKEELGSMIDHQSADVVAYDGQKLHRYVADESGKCFGKGTKIRMWDGSIKNIEDIDNGEFVMGNDSTSRLVYGKTSGVENLYRIVPNKGDGFVCNESHILTLSVSDRLNINGKRYEKGDIVNISVREYFDIKECYRKCLAIYRTGWELPYNNHLISPYLIGTWLGDGCSRDFSITSVDKEIIDVVYNFAKKEGLSVRVKEDKISYHVTSNKIGINHITKELRRLNLLKNKHIPQEYLLDSKHNRLQLLAGLIDTDGYVDNTGHSSKVEIIQKNQKLAMGIQELATSIGFYSSIIPKEATMKRTDGTIYRCIVYRVGIYGDVDLIPTKVPRKQIIVSRTKNRRNPQKTGFKIEPIGTGEYFGFAVNDNHLFLLSDGTVVHNTVECNIYDRHEVVRYCLLDDEGKIIGKALYTTTVEKVETDRDGVQEAFKLLWDESDQLNRMENGRTPSGLYRFFMSSDRARNFDIYGFPDIEKTISEILADRKSVEHNPRALSARIRKEARTVSEAFSIDGDKCVFNIINLNNRENELKENPIHKRNILFYMDEETQKVKWRDAIKTEMDFCWRVSPDFSLKDEVSNKKMWEAGLVKPGNTRVGAISVDSYSNSQGGRKYGSKASAWIGLKLDVNNPEHTLKPVAHLYGRPNVKEELHKQVMYAAIYCGFEAFYEHTADDYWNYFRERGKSGYLGRYPMSLIDPTKKDTQERHRGTPITPFSLTKQLDNGIAYIEKYCYKIDFEEFFPQAKKFDPYNRTESDMVVSFLILISVLIEPVNIPQSPKTPLVRVYPNYGVTAMN